MLPEQTLVDSSTIFETAIDSARLACDGMSIQELQQAYRTASRLVHDIVENVCFKAKHTPEAEFSKGASSMKPLQLALNRKCSETTKPTASQFNDGLLLHEDRASSTSSSLMAFTADPLKMSHEWQRDLLEQSEMRACLVCQRKRNRAVLTRHGCRQCVLASSDRSRGRKNSSASNLPVPLCSQLCHAVHHEEAADQLNSVTSSISSTLRNNVAANFSVIEAALNGNNGNGVKSSASSTSTGDSQSSFLGQLSPNMNNDLSALLQSQILASVCGAVMSNNPLLHSNNQTSCQPTSHDHNKSGNSKMFGEPVKPAPDYASFKQQSNASIPVRTRGRPRLHNFVTTRVSTGRRGRGRGSASASLRASPPQQENQPLVATHSLRGGRSRGRGMPSLRGRPPLHTYAVFNNHSSNNNGVMTSNDGFYNRKRNRSEDSNSSDLPAIKPLVRESMGLGLTPTMQHVPAAKFSLSALQSDECLDLSTNGVFNMQRSDETDEKSPGTSSSNMMVFPPCDHSIIDPVDCKEDDYEEKSDIYTLGHNNKLDAPSMVA